METKIEIRINNNKYGIVDSLTGHTVIPFEYDNIFSFYENDKEYILCKSGQFGAVYIDTDNSFKWIAPCKYDTCNSFGLHRDLLFSKGSNIRYYFWDSNSFRDFTHIQLFENYIFAIDADRYYILRINTGEILWTCYKKDPLYDFTCGNPCLVFMGEADKVPLFYDCTNNGYILPQENSKLEYKNNVPSTIKPIIINGKNIVNIVDNLKGVNAVEYIGQNINKEINYDYDEATVELKVKLKKGEQIEERIYQIPNGHFNAGDVCDLSEW